MKSFLSFLRLTFSYFISTVLNLPKTASEQEIRDRYKQLSVLFHPDKQHDPSKVETATKRFLEVQKAYEGKCRTRLALPFS